MIHYVVNDLNKLGYGARSSFPGDINWERIRREPSVMFGALAADTSYLISYSSEKYERARVTTRPFIKALVEGYSTPVSEMPDYVKRPLEKFGVKETYTGIPPALGLSYSDWKGLRHLEMPRNTAGPIAYVLLDILKEVIQEKKLFRPASIEESKAIIDNVCQLVSDKAQEYGKRVLQQSDTFNQTVQRPLNVDVYRGPNLILYGKPAVLVRPWEGHLFSSLQSGHLVFLAPNGAIQILVLPSDDRFVGMVDSMPALAPVKEHHQELIDQMRNLNPYVTTRADGKRTLHNILETEMLDYAVLTGSDKFRVACNIPGTDGKDVWGEPVLSEAG